MRVLDYVRGNISLRGKKERAKLEKTYHERDPLPPKKYTLRIVNQKKGAQFYINDNFAGFLPFRSQKPASFRRIITPLAKDHFTFSDKRPCERFHFLNIARLNAPGFFRDARIDYHDDKKIPFGKVTSANMDLGRTANQISLYPNKYGDSGQTGRNAFDHAEASYLFTVPMQQYSHVWLLCAANSNPLKGPTLTARLTRYVPSGRMGGRAYSAIADTRTSIPTENAEKVGKVTVGKKVFPLWRVKIPLAMGKVVDLVTHLPGKYGRGAYPFHYLDFELTGITPLYRTPFGDPRIWPSRKRVSSIHVFGATLERSPIDIKILQTSPSKNMFDDTMKPAMKVGYKRVFPGRYFLEWEISDHTGKLLRKERTALEGEKGIRSISLQMKKLGWYKVVFTVKEEEKKEILFRHNASFTLMGKDTRRALWDSPYIGWSRGYVHYGSNTPETEGLRARMLGVRRTTGLHQGFYKVVNGKRVRIPEKEWEKYKLTTLLAHKFSQRELKNFQKKGEAKIIEEIRELLKQYPNAIQIPLLWENTPPFGPYAQAPELYGFKPSPYSAERKKNAAERWEMIQYAQKILRKHFPNLVIMYGNSLTSTELIAEALRQKPPKNFTDYWGTEAIQRTAHPEKPFLHFTMMCSNEMNRIAEIMGYGHIKTAAGPENIARKADTIGLHRHAEWFVRDMLLQHIFKFRFIAGATAGGGVGNVYDASFYAGGPAREPYCYPNPSASATGTLTRILDQVEFIRMFPTSSNTVYCAEFKRKYDKKIIYALWTSRGEADLKIKTTSSNIEHVEFHGQSSFPSIWFRTLRLTAGTAAKYILTDAPFASVKITGRRIAPEKDGDPEEFYIADKADSTDFWKLDRRAVPLVEGKKKTDRKTRYPAKKASVKMVRDEEKGNCLELSIRSDRTLNDFFSEYMVIRPEKPILIKDEIESIGLWVKGNSGWGEIFFELVDASGDRRISCTNLADYTGRCSIDYDGAWAFLSMPVTEKSKIRDLSTGSVNNIWTGRWRTPVMPCKITGIYFCAPVKPFFHNQGKYVDQTIRIRDISVRTRKEKAVPEEGFARKIFIAGTPAGMKPFQRKALERDWGLKFSLTVKKRMKKWFDNGIVFPDPEPLAQERFDAVCIAGSAVTKKSLPLIKNFAEKGGIVVLGYTIAAQCFRMDAKSSAELFGFQKPKALHHIPYTGKKSMEHKVKYLPGLGKKRSWEYKRVYAPFATELTAALPLAEHEREKGYFLATVNKVGKGYVIFTGSNDAILLTDLFEYLFRKIPLK